MGVKLRNLIAEVAALESELAIHLGPRIGKDGTERWGSKDGETGGRATSRSDPDQLSKAADRASAAAEKSKDPIDHASANDAHGIAAKALRDAAKKATSAKEKARLTAMAKTHEDTASEHADSEEADRGIDRETVKVAKGILGGTAQVGWNNVRWSKQGGYADSAFSRIEKKLKAAGFKQESSSSGGNADGSVMGNSKVWKNKKTGATAEFSASYGATKDYNRFSVTIRPKGKG